MSEHSTPARGKRLYAHIGLALMLLASALTGCGVDSGTIETVDDAVKLLQDIERNGLWSVTQDGLEALADQGDYIATLQIESTRLTQEDAPPYPQLALTVQVDADGDARYTLAYDDTTAQYAQFHTAGAAGEDASLPAGVYREDDGYYTCADGVVQDLLRHGLAGVLETYALDTIGARTLAVVEEDSDSTIAGRDGTHYTAEARLNDALEILERTEEDALRAQIETTEAGELSGSLDLDDATGALLHLAVSYRNATGNQQLTLTFDVTQWGDVPDILLPTAENITPCTGS